MSSLFVHGQYVLPCRSNVQLVAKKLPDDQNRSEHFMPENGKSKVVFANHAARIGDQRTTA
ncbi:hypothetical protein AC579_4292 [Pseudocercospora musae]|uniref:Uncharacterized protein n=1 Tax=Pseudocercospora musae TaxID=113226 RepID=A0A139IAT4_9PEZI|nr:hypothetical protein AC579_4292 [Pseudocercospora musae]